MCKALKGLRGHRDRRAPRVQPDGKAYKVLPELKVRKDSKAHKDPRVLRVCWDRQVLLVQLVQLV